MHSKEAQLLALKDGKMVKGIHESLQKKPPRNERVPQCKKMLCNCKVPLTNDFLKKSSFPRPKGQISVSWQCEAWCCPEERRTNRKTEAWLVGASIMVAWLGSCEFTINTKLLGRRQFETRSNMKREVRLALLYAVPRGIYSETVTCFSLLWKMEWWLHCWKVVQLKGG